MCQGCRLSRLASDYFERWSFAMSVLFAAWLMVTKFCASFWVPPTVWVMAVEVVSDHLGAASYRQLVWTAFGLTCGGFCYWACLASGRQSGIHSELLLLWLWCKSGDPSRSNWYMWPGQTPFLPILQKLWHNYAQCHAKSRACSAVCCPWSHPGQGINK